MRIFLIFLQAFQNKSLTGIIALEQQRKKLNSEINKLKSEIKSCNQFNKKVELNAMLNKKEVELLRLI
jgi:cell division protein FtsB